MLDFRKLELNKAADFHRSGGKGRIPSLAQRACGNLKNQSQYGTEGVPAHGGGKNHRNTAPCRQRHSLG